MVELPRVLGQAQHRPRLRGVRAGGTAPATAAGKRHHPQPSSTTAGQDMGPMSVPQENNK